MMIEVVPLIVAILSFGTVAAIVFVVGEYLTTEAQMRRRLPASARAPDSPIGVAPRTFHLFIAKHFDEKRFGVDSTMRGKLRRELLRAGYFRIEAINGYIFARIVVAVFLPVGVYILLQFFLQDVPWFFKLVLIGSSIALAIVGPDIYLDRRQKRLARHYRQLFPDLLDLLVVCVDAGLSLEAAFNRITGEIIVHSRPLGLHLMMMDAEMRAGRSTIEALESFADRLTLDEARSLVLVLRQSLELGSDVSDTLRVFSDDMRDRRVLRAEENANKLPVKMTAPLGLFIFPVVLLVVLFPVGIRLAKIIATQ
jgi:tight adherence protein C